MKKIYLFIFVVVLVLLALPEPATRIATNPTPTGDIRSYIGILIILVIIVAGMIVSNIVNKKDN
jgi:hypothetical protein